MAKKRQRHSLGNGANQSTSQPSPKKQRLGDGHARQPGPSKPSADTNGEGHNRIGPSDDRKAQEHNSVVKTLSTEAPTHLSRKQRKRWRKRLEEAGEAAAAQYAAQAFAEGNSEQASNQSPAAAKNVADSARKPVSKDFMRKVTATTLATPPRKRWIEMDAQPSRRWKQEEKKGVGKVATSSSARKGKSDQAEPASKDALPKEDDTKASEVAPTSQPLVNSASNSSGNSQVQGDTAPVGKLPESVATSDERSSTPKKTTNEDASDDSDNETDDASDESSNHESKGALPGSAKSSKAPPQSEGASTKSGAATSSEVKAKSPASAAPGNSLLETLRTASEIPYSSSVRTSPVAPSLSSFGASLRNSYGGPGGSLAFTAPVGTKPTSVPTTNVREDVRTVFDRFSAFVSGHDGGDSDDDDDDEDDESSSDESEVVKDARPASGQRMGVPLDEKSRAASVEDAKSMFPSGGSEGREIRGKHQASAEPSATVTDIPGSGIVEQRQPTYQRDSAAGESTDDGSDAESESADSDSSKPTRGETKPMPQLDGVDREASAAHQRNAADEPDQSSVETESDSEETNNAAVVPASPARQQKSNSGGERQPVAAETAVEGDGANVESANDNTPEVVNVQGQMSTSTTSASNAGEGNDNVRNENEEESLHQYDSAGETESEAEEEEPSLDVKPASPAKYDIHDSVRPDGRSRTGTRSQSLQNTEKACTTPPFQKVELRTQTNDQHTAGPSRSRAEPHTDEAKNMTAARDQSAKPQGVDQAAASDDSSESDSENDENWPSLLLHRSSKSHSSPHASRSQQSRDHEPNSERDSGSGEDDTPASQIQRELGQEQTDPASSGTVIVPDSTNTSQQTKGANGDAVDNQSDGDDNETDDADAKVQSPQADKGCAETAQAPTAFTPINAAAEAHSKADIGSRSTRARPNNKKQISFLDQRPGSAGSEPTQTAAFPDRMGDDDINQTIDEISRDVLKNSTRPLPPSKNLNQFAHTNADDPDSGDLTIDPSLHELEHQLAAHHRVAKEVAIPLPDPRLFKNVIVYCSREVPVFKPQLEVGLSSLERIGRGVEDEGDASGADAMQNMVGNTGGEHQDTNMSGVGLPLLQEQNSSSSLSELGLSPSPPATQSKVSSPMHDQPKEVADKTPRSQDDLSQVEIVGKESENVGNAEEDRGRDVVPPTEVRKKRKMTGMTSKHFSPPKRTTRARAKTETPAQTPSQETKQAVIPGDGIETTAEPTSDTAEPPTPATKKPRPKRKATGKKSNHFLPFDLLDRVDLPLPPPPPSSTTSPTRPRPVPGISRAPIPPISSPTFGIIQEKLHAEPFWLLIATTFLNQTSGRAAVPVFWALKNRFPTPDALAEAEYEVVLEMIRHLGLQRQRARRVIAMARVWRLQPPVRGRRFRTKDYPCKGDHVGFNVRGRGGKGKGKGKKGKRGRGEGKDGEEEKDGERDFKEEEHGDEEEKMDAGGDSGSNEAVSGLEGDTTECKGSLEIGHVPGCGRYAYDSWRIFCRDVLRGVAEDYNGKGAISPPATSPASADAATAEAGAEAEAEALTRTKHNPPSHDPQPASQTKPKEEGEEVAVPFEPEWKRVLPQDKELIATLRWMWLREGWIWDPSSGAKRPATWEEMDRARRGEMEVQDLRERKFAERALLVGGAELDGGGSGVGNRGVGGGVGEEGEGM
ncbi:hypothetical protein KC340_g16405 [Hortaea werneckii]|nr:hypothetical protein KC342_g16713 [Hortaea werneckii]KAI7067975.1 hypothetical protein KC339_g15190 [Hortaea werneckii]KAI7210771.1 hypothetical protein KC365_g15183 [Hortaea werneckii]KAI7293707.1 hypothetical protein KC340_g16405 [Hortaea werneckii]KAI7374941.1 hypothetical protein KC328_g15741 [Hortaea werneckii]